MAGEHRRFQGIGESGLVSGRNCRRWNGIAGPGQQRASDEQYIASFIGNGDGRRFNGRLNGVHQRIVRNGLSFAEAGEHSIECLIVSGRQQLRYQTLQSRVPVGALDTAAGLGESGGEPAKLRHFSGQSGAGTIRGAFHPRILPSLGAVAVSWERNSLVP